MLFRCVFDYLDAKFGYCDHRLPPASQGEAERCPNIIQRLKHLNALKMDGLAVIEAKTGCTLACERVEHSSFLVTKQDIHLMFSGRKR